MKQPALLLFVLVISARLLAQTSSLDSFVTSYVKKNNFSGTVLVQQKGKTIYHKSAGLANIQFSIPAKNDTRYKIASVTKFFTAVLIMQLQEEGKIDIEQTVGTYLPAYKEDGIGKVKISQLLNHTSGLTNMDTTSSIESAVKNGIPPYQKPYTPDELMKKFASGPLAKEPGKTFDYNNADYIALGKIIEQATGKSYKQVLNEKILQPLQMTNSGLLSQHEIIPNLADTYFFRDDLNQLVNDLPAYIDNWYASGAMYSTSNDLLKFTTALFGKNLLKKESLDKMFVSGLEEYGYGVWVYMDYKIKGKNYTIVKRPGRIMGAQSMIFHILEDNTTLIILSNTAGANLDDFAAKLANRAISTATAAIQK